MVYKILVGSYTSSVSLLTFDTSSTPPSLKLSSSTAVGHHPSWITRHPTIKDIAIATVEQSDGKLSVLKAVEDKVEVVANVSSGGEDPAHCEVLENEVIVGNYSGSSILSLPFSSTSPHLSSPQAAPIKFSGTGPNTDRQEKSHPHQVYHHPSRVELLIPDLGADKVWRLLRTSDGKGWEVKGDIDFEKGSGPRHCIVVGDTLYTVGELTSTLITHSLPPLPTPAQHIATSSTLSTPSPPSKAMLAAEILHTPGYLYVSNRNDPSPSGDPIAIFSRQGSNSEAKRISELRTGLKHARGMAFDKEGKYLIVGGANAGGIKIFERLEGGVEFREVAKTEEVESPTSFVWI